MTPAARRRSSTSSSGSTPRPSRSLPGPRGSRQARLWQCYKKFGDAWDRIWTYRRLKGKGAKAAVGDICLQNWGYSGRDGEGGNDYPFGYLFKSRSRPLAETTGWAGVDLAVLAAAEKRALAWHYWFKANVPAPFVPGR